MVFRDERKKLSTTELAGGVAGKERHFKFDERKIEPRHRERMRPDAQGCWVKRRIYNRQVVDLGRTACNKIHPGTLCPVTYVTKTILHQVSPCANYMDA